MEPEVSTEVSDIVLRAVQEDPYAAIVQAHNAGRQNYPVLRAAYIEMLKRYKGNLSRLAQHFNIARETLRTRIQDLDLAQELNMYRK